MKISGEAKREKWRLGMKNDKCHGIKGRYCTISDHGRGWVVSYKGMIRGGKYGTGNG